VIARKEEATMQDPKRAQITGTAVALPGNDIDTDRIIPARFLRCVTFDGIGEHAFEDDRKQLAAAGQTHPFDQASFQDATILVANRNFGCGSSREHAPQALMRWNKGIQAIIGESFAEIFFGNCVVLGIPCLVAAQSDVNALLAAVQADPKLSVTVDVVKQEVRYGGKSFKATMPDGPREQLTSGQWDTTAELLAAKDSIEATAKKLPYFAGF
jgi:3-isopropylmalate/(R)-2-methylmalate dehydratase small subunit